MKIILLLITTMLLTACSSGLEGTYVDKLGTTTMIFESNGTVEFTTWGTSMELSYEVENEKVKIDAPNNQKLVMDILEDGSISGPGGLKFTKRGNE